MTWPGSMGLVQVRTTFPAPPIRHISESVLSSMCLRSNPSVCLALGHCLLRLTMEAQETAICVYYPGFSCPSCLLSPMAGITRLQRWRRAEQMGLKPPLEVYQVLKAHPEDPHFQCRSGQAGIASRGTRDFSRRCHPLGLHRSYLDLEKWQQT